MTWWPNVLISTTPAAPPPTADVLHRRSLFEEGVFKSPTWLLTIAKLALGTNAVVSGDIVG